MLLQKRGNPSRIKILLAYIKNLSVGIVGSLIASGIVGIISKAIQAVNKSGNIVEL